MTAKTMAEVIINHSWLPDHEGLYTGLCPSCPGVKIHGGHNSPSHAAHIAEALSAAGFGLVADAKAEALEEAAANIITNDPLDYWNGHLPEGLGFQEAMSRWLKAHAKAKRATS